MIDYHKVAQALDGYERFGFKYVEVPWVVSREIAEATISDSREAFQLVPAPVGGEKYPVGSAEQGFMELFAADALKPGTYSAAGPCFRNEPYLDTLHHTTFFKVELCRYFGKQSYWDVGLITKAVDQVQDMAYVAQHVMQQMSYPKIEQVQTDSGFDLVLNGIEVGSYGWRSWNSHVWVYGTGIALPRFEQARAARQ